MATKEALDRAVKTRKEIRKENQDTVLEDTENKFKQKYTKEDDEYIIQNRGERQIKRYWVRNWKNRNRCCTKDIFIKKERIN